MKPNRFYSKKQETKVAKALNMKRTPNSGATVFIKGDVMDDDLLIECKTLTRKQKQHTIKKEWLDKNEEEAFATRKELSALAFDFGDGKNYYILNEADFKSLYSAYKEVKEGERYREVLEETKEYLERIEKGQSLERSFYVGYNLIEAIKTVNKALEGESNE